MCYVGETDTYVCETSGGRIKYTRTKIISSDLRTDYSREKQNVWEAKLACTAAMTIMCVWPNEFKVWAESYEHDGH